MYSMVRLITSVFPSFLFGGFFLYVQYGKAHYECLSKPFFKAFLLNQVGIT
jgi:hypothetical protein